MANKTFIPGVTDTNLAGCLQEEYAALDITGFSKQYTIKKDTIFVLERDRYAKGDKTGKISDPNLIPLVEISNKMHEGSPILFGQTEVIALSPSTY